MNIAASRKLINFISIIGLGLSIALTIYFINLGVFKDLNALRGLVGDSIILGPVILSSSKSCKWLFQSFLEESALQRVF